MTSFSIDFETIDTKWKSAHSNTTACLELLDYLNYPMILPQLHIDRTKLYGMLQLFMKVWVKIINLTLSMS